MNLFNRKKKHPEDLDQLMQLHPVRTYTRNDVNTIMSLMSGVVFDGYPIKEWEVIADTPRWFAVEVTFDTYLDPDDDEVEVWYFYKSEERESAV